MPRIGRARLAALLVLGVAGALVQPISSVSAAPAVPQTAAFGPAIEAAGDYQAQRICDPVPRPGVNSVKQLLLRTYGDRVIYIPRYGCSGTSEHHEGRALDWMINARVASQKATADAFIAWLLRTDKHGNTNAMAKRMGVMYIIWNNRMWRAYDPGRGWTDYKSCSTRTSSGNDTECHRDHVHISFTWDGAMGRTSFYTGRVYDAGTTCAPLPTSTTSSATANDELFVPVPRARLVSSGSGLGTQPGVRCRLEQDDYAGQGRRMDVQVAGRAGVPASGASAVALSVVASTNAPTSVRVWPTGWTRPATVQVTAGAARAGRSMVVVPLGKGGRISLATAAGAQFVAIDVMGYYTRSRGVMFNPLATASRAATDVVIAPGADRTLRLGGKGGVPASGVSGVSLSVTSSASSAASTVSVRKPGALLPAVEAFAVSGSAARVSSITAATADDGSLVLRNTGTVPVTLDIDVTGWFGTTGMTYASRTGVKVLDTRSGVGASGAVRAGSTVTFPVRGVGGIPTTASAVALQLSAVAPQRSVSARVFPSKGALPVGPVIATEGASPTTQYVIARIGSDGRIALRGGGGTSDYRAYVVGWWTPTTRVGVVTGTGDAMPATYSVRATTSSGALVLPGSTTIRATVGPVNRAAGRAVWLQRWTNGAWRTVATANASRTGSVTFPVVPAARGTVQYRVLKPSDGCGASGCTWTRAASGTLRVTAVQKYVVTASFVDPTVRRGTAATLRGRVTPTPAGGTVVVQRRISTGWITWVKAPVRSDGTYSARLLPSRAGTYPVRVWKLPDECTAGVCLRWAGVSPVRTLVAS